MTMKVIMMMIILIFNRKSGRSHRNSSRDNGSDENYNEDLDSVTATSIRPHLHSSTKIPTMIAGQNITGNSAGNISGLAEGNITGIPEPETTTFDQTSLKATQRMVIVQNATSLNLENLMHYEEYIIKVCFYLHTKQQTC